MDLFALPIPYGIGTSPGRPLWTFGFLHEYKRVHRFQAVSALCPSHIDQAEQGVLQDCPNS